MCDRVLPVGDNVTRLYTEKDLILQVEVEKDLGIYFDSKLSFREHITKKVNIANRNLGCIFRSFTYMDKEKFLLVQIPG